MDHSYGAIAKGLKEGWGERADELLAPIEGHLRMPDASNWWVTRGGAFTFLLEGLVFFSRKLRARK